MIQDRTNNTSIPVSIGLLTYASFMINPIDPKHQQATTMIKTPTKLFLVVISTRSSSSIFGYPLVNLKMIKTKEVVLGKLSTFNG